MQLLIDDLGEGLSHRSSTSANYTIYRSLSKLHSLFGVPSTHLVMAVQRFLKMFYLIYQNEQVGWYLNLKLGSFLHSCKNYRVPRKFSVLAEIFNRSFLTQGDYLLRFL